MAKNIWLKLVMVGVMAVSVWIVFLIASKGACACSPAANESAAVVSLRTLYSANIAYAKGHPKDGYPGKLRELSSRSDESEQHNDAEWVVDPFIAGGVKSAYKFTYSPRSSMGDENFDTYEVRADPLEPGKSGKRHFFMNETGVVRVSETGPANATDPALH